MAVDDRSAKGIALALSAGIDRGVLRPGERAAADPAGGPRPPGRSGHRQRRLVAAGAGRADRDRRPTRHPGARGVGRAASLPSRARLPGRLPGRPLDRPARSAPAARPARRDAAGATRRHGALLPRGPRRARPARGARGVVAVPGRGADRRGRGDGRAQPVRRRAPAVRRPGRGRAAVLPPAARPPGDGGRRPDRGRRTTPRGRSSRMSWPPWTPARRCSSSSRGGRTRRVSRCRRPGRGPGRRARGSRRRRRRGRLGRRHARPGLPCRWAACSPTGPCWCGASPRPTAPTCGSPPSAGRRAVVDPIVERRYLGQGWSSRLVQSILLDLLTDESLAGARGGRAGDVRRPDGRDGRRARGARGRRARARRHQRLGAGGRAGRGAAPPGRGRRPRGERRPVLDLPARVRPHPDHHRLDRTAPTTAWPTWSPTPPAPAPGPATADLVTRCPQLFHADATTWKSSGQRVTSEMRR